METQHKLLIRIRTERVSLGKFINFFVRDKQRFQVIQDEIFELSLIIKNIGGSAFNGGKISGLELKSSDSQTLCHPVQKEFTIPSINPGEEYSLKVTKMLTILCGPAWVDLKIKSLNESESIQTFQMDKATQESCMPNMNSWGDGILIYSQQENATRNTNLLILLLTITTAWEAIFGIKKTIFFFLNILSFLFIQLSNLLLYLNVHYFLIS